MLGAKLARRIVVPLLLAVAGVFALLAAAAVVIADARVEAELEDKADRIAATLEGLPQPRPEIVDALARLMAAGLVLDGLGTDPGWDPAELKGIGPGTVTLGSTAYRVLERRLARGGRLLVLEEEERLARRRRDVLAPIALAGAVGLVVALALGLLVARAIARPVRELRDSVRGFGEGRRELSPGAAGPGEIADLQEAFVKMAEAIRAGERKLRESERFAALGRLAGGIAHELRNPLTAIRMAIETGASGDEEARAEGRRIALAEIDRLDRTLRELLDFVRPRRPALRDLPVARLLEDVVTLLRPQCDHLRVRLEVDAPRDLVVKADEDRLKQALLNLVLNGAQAQPQGGVVRLRARAGRIEVEDEGGGIPAEVMESLLQPFVTTKEGGIGLGLAVVAQVAEEHGARLDFKTGRGGTTFTLSFPA
jgi:signal transduction histidine kinase